MKHPGTSHAASSCTPSRLDRLLAAELPAAEAEALRAHVQRCSACAHELAWQRQERGLFLQRTRRRSSAAAARPALRWEALEQRLRQAVPAVRARAQWGHRGTMALGALAAVLVAGFSVMLSAQPATELDAWVGGSSSEWMTRAPSPEADCIEPGPDAVARHEARFGACLLASPLISRR